MVDSVEDWLKIVQWFYKHVDGPPPIRPIAMEGMVEGMGVLPVVPVDYRVAASAITTRPESDRDSPGEVQDTKYGSSVGEDGGGGMR
jgi:hypothetical protein